MESPYPFARFERFFTTREVFAVYLEGALVGTFTICTGNDEYGLHHWANPGHQALYLSKLAILPEHQGRGLGSACLGAIEELAAQRCCQAIRFDAVSRHELLLKFYQRLGYQSRGVIQVRDGLQRNWDITLFEKVLG